MADEAGAEIRQLPDMIQRLQRLLVAGGGGGHDGYMEARVAKLEASAEYIQREIADLKLEVRSLRNMAVTDFRVLFGAIIAATLGLAALMARGFHWI